MVRTRAARRRTDGPCGKEVTCWGEVATRFKERAANAVNGKMD
jgi:hypothetical protein